MSDLLSVLIGQRESDVDGSIYKTCQCDFAYNSGRIDGSTLTLERVMLVYEHEAFKGSGDIDDLIEARNHFRAFDFILDNVSEPLSHDLLCHLYGMLEAGTSNSLIPTLNVGGYRLLSSDVIDGVTHATVEPHEIESHMDRLLSDWNACDGGDRTIERVAEFLYRLERISPFSNGNGRIGRLIMFKECLRLGEMPFIITGNIKERYIYDLKIYPTEKKNLTDTLKFSQDRFVERYAPLAGEFSFIFEKAKAGPLTEQLKEALGM